MQIDQLHRILEGPLLLAGGSPGSSVGVRKRRCDATPVREGPDHLERETDLTRTAAAVLGMEESGCPK
jgi:hypothetical protein